MGVWGLGDAGRSFQAEETAISPQKAAGCLLSSNAKAESSLDFKDQAFPKQEVNKKIRLCKNAICGQFFQRNHVVPVGLVVCHFWELLGKQTLDANIGFSRRLH